MTAWLLLVHGDDGFAIDGVLRDFANRVGAAERTEVTPERSPDEAAIDRARLASASVGMFGASAAARFVSLQKNRQSHHGTYCRVWCTYLRSSSLAISQKMPRRPSGVLQPVSCPLLRRMSAVEPR